MPDKQPDPYSAAVPGPPPGPIGPDLLEMLETQIQADIYCYSGPIFDDEIHVFLDGICAHKSRKNIALILTTYGGSPDAAFRLCRCLKHTYEKFYLYIPGYCKSAGTLVALGADEVIMLKRGEIGPLDVQIAKRDDLARRSSGLDISDAIAFISNKSFEIFEEHFTTIIASSGGQITTKTAGEIATGITVGLMSPITQQLDPFQIGENQRAMNIAFEYGKLLGASEDALQKLIKGYPTHAFVIDFQEAKEEGLLSNLREPTVLEDSFFETFCQMVCQRFEENLLREPSSKNLFATFINPPAPTAPTDTHGNANTTATDQPASAGSPDIAPAEPSGVQTEAVPPHEGAPATDSVQDPDNNGAGNQSVSAPSLMRN